jgi:hypothetical protein
MPESFHVNFGFSGPVVLEKKICRVFSLYKVINICKKFPLLWPHETLGGYVLNKLVFGLCQTAFM